MSDAAWIIILVALGATFVGVMGWGMKRASEYNWPPTVVYERRVSP